MTTDLQLDIWNEIIMEKVDAAQERLKYIDLMQEPAKYGMQQGYINGLLESVTLLGVVEKEQRMRSKIETVKAKLLLKNNYGADDNYAS